MALDTYTPTDWSSGDLITEEKIDHIEQGIFNNNKVLKQIERLSSIQYVGPIPANMTRTWANYSGDYSGLLVVVSRDPEACAFGYVLSG